MAIVVWGTARIGSGLAGGLAHGTAGTVLWIAVAFLAIGGAADMVSSAFRNTILQQAASDDVRGRLQSLFTAVVAAAPPLALVVHPAPPPAVGPPVAAP